MKKAIALAGLAVVFAMFGAAVYLAVAPEERAARDAERVAVEKARQMLERERALCAAAARDFQERLAAKPTPVTVSETLRGSFDQGRTKWTFRCEVRNGKAELVDLHQAEGAR